MTSILLVCTGNVCRSPMAEGFLRAEVRDRFGEVAPSVSSAGTSGWENARAMPESVRAAEELGVDISDHVGRRLTPEMVRDADLVIGMASEHRERVMEDVPEAASRTFTLKELVRLVEALPPIPAAAEPGSLPWRVAQAEAARRYGAAPASGDKDIADPLGQPIDAYRAVGWEIEQWLARLVVGLFGPGHAEVPSGVAREAAMRIAIGSDHAGFALKEDLKEFLESEGHEVIDVGTDSDEPVDYPQFCAAAARAVVDGRADRAIVLGGSGQGEQIVANKIDGIRAALCHDIYAARLSRAHNDANVLSIGARMIATDYARVIVRVWLGTPFEGGRHARRLEQIAKIERGER